MITMEYADLYINGENIGQPIYFPRCLTCRLPYPHWYSTTVHCGECELNGRANMYRGKATTKADKEAKL